MAGQAAGVVGVQHHIGRRVVGVLVHGVRAVERAGGRKPDVPRRGPQDPRTHLGSALYAKAPMFVNLTDRPARINRQLGPVTSDLLAEMPAWWTIDCQ